MEQRLDEPLAIERPRAARPERTLPERQHHERGRQHTHESLDLDCAEFAAFDAARDGFCQQRMPGLDDFVDEETRNFGEVAALGHHQLADPSRRAVTVVGPPAANQTAQQLVARAREAKGLVGGLAEPGDDAVADDGLEEVFLVLEIEIERSFRNTGAGRNIFQAGARISLLDEQLQRRRDQFRRARFFAAFPAWLGRRFSGGH